MKMIRYDSLASTNDAVRGEKHLTLVHTPKQEKGRGQRGNSWESEPFSNLTFSILLEPSFLPVDRQFELSMLISLAISALLNRLGLEASIKWPNDIYIGDRKICGILIENEISSSGLLCRSVIGVGLNVNQRVFLSGAPNPTSVILETGRESNLEEVLEIFIDEFYKLYTPWSEGKYPSIKDDYESLLYRRGFASRFRDSGGEFTGIIKGVAEWGTLRLDRNGEERRYHFKEVEYLIKTV